jgi:hypothetical protein
MVTAQTRLTIGESALGTPEYMSPEQARGDEDIDHRTDLYSAGVVLYEMLTCRTPFKAATPSAVIHRILYEDPQAPQKVDRAADPQLASLAVRLLAKRREDRFDSAANALAALDADKRVGSPAKGRRRFRAVLTAITAVMLLTAVLYLMALQDRRSEPSAPAPGVRGRIREVKVVTDENDVNTLVIRARYGDDSRWSVFYQDFPPEGERVVDVALANQDGEGSQVVVAGTSSPVDGDCLFGFDADGKRIWSKDLSPVEDMGWPSVTPHYWRCTSLVSHDLDGRPGDEVIVAATHSVKYPARVSIRDPADGDDISTFWHMGHVNYVGVCERFFGSRPAIIACGKNNAAAGLCDQPASSGLAGAIGRICETDLRVVPVVMVLDPQRMDGVGPPGGALGSSVLPAYVHAYAFLNLPYDPDPSTTRQSPVGIPSNSFVPEKYSWAEVGNIHEWKKSTGKPTSDDTPWLDIPVFAADPDRDDKELERGSLIVNCQLNLVDWTSNSTTGDTTTTSYWRRVWQPVIQNGQYVREVR